MVGQVHEGIRIGGHPVVHAEGIVLGEGIAHGDLQTAGEAVLAVRAFRLHQQGVAEGLDPVDLAVEAAVQVVGTAVGFQLVGLAAHAEHRILDAVGIAAHKRTAAGAAGGCEIRLIIRHGIVPHNDIHRAVFRRHDDVLDDAAIIQYADRQAAGIGKNILGYICALSGHTEGLGADLCHWAFASSGFFGTRPGRLPPSFHCIYDYITVLCVCVSLLLEFASNFLSEFL